MLIGPTVIAQAAESLHKLRDSARFCLGNLGGKEAIEKMERVRRDEMSILRDTLAKKVHEGPQEIDMLHWMSRTALELVGQSGLGYSFDTLTENAVLHPYSVAVKKFMPVSFHFVWARNYLLPFLSKIGSPKFRRFMIDILPWKELHELRDIVDVLQNTAVEIVESKKKALAEGDDAVLRQVGQVR